jgi:hypothetical protein
MDTRLQVLDVFRLRLIFCVFLDTSLILAVVLQLLQVVCGGSNTCGNTFGLGLEPPCDWNEDVCSNAAYSGYLDVLQCARAQEPPCDWNEGVCSRAAAYGNLDVLKKEVNSRQQCNPLL